VPSQSWAEPKPSHALPSSPRTGHYRNVPALHTTADWLGSNRKRKYWNSQTGSLSACENMHYATCGFSNRFWGMLPMMEIKIFKLKLHINIFSREHFMIYEV
jgi:hypothetical protein